MISAHASDQPYLAVAGFVVGNSMGAGPPQNNDFEGLNDRTLRQADTALGHILEHVTPESHAEDTVVIIAAGRGTNTAESAEGAMREPSIRVPLSMRGKGIDRQIVEPPVSTTDVAPTILDLAGVPIPQRMQGVSLLGGAEVARGWAMSRLRAPGKACPWQTALRAGHRKLVACHGNPASGDPVTYKLFDLDDDPNELNDLAGTPAHATDLEEMIDLMIDARCALEDRTEPRIASF